jgi:hypothetical protein
MMPTKKVYIVNGSGAYASMFLKAGFTVLASLDADIPDLVCFTGGEDVTPQLYGEDKHPSTYNSLARDTQERVLFKEFGIAEIPMVGICRGGQFLNVMNGGKMYQHVSNHTRSHVLTDLISKEKVFVTSTHHQMMRKGPTGILIATAEEKGFKQHMENGIIKTVDVDEPDTEVVFYPHTQCLCYQPHPEYDDPIHQEYFFSLVKRHLGVKA